MLRSLLMAILLATPTPAVGQAPAPEINLQLHRPAPDPNAVLAAPTAEVSGHLNYHFGLTADWSRRPLRLTIADEGVPLGDVIADRVDVHLGMSLGLWTFLEVGADVPVVAYQHGINTEIVERVLGTSNVPTSSLGDVALYVKGQVLAADGLLPAIALGAEVSVPTGKPEGFIGEPAAVVLPFLALSQRIDNDIWTLQLGYRLRFEPMHIAGIEIDDELVYRFGVAYRIGRLPSDTPATLLVELAGQTPAAHPFGIGGGDDVRALTSLETRVGLRYPWRTGVGGIRVTPALGVGVLPAVGSPQLRFLLGFDWLDREPRGDDDGDRVPNFADTCPRAREDMDDFEDSDGCPEEDNDQDGIPDEDDECPEEPEDKDGFQDRDGCADSSEPDTDGDGIFDKEDECPEQDEDPDGFEDWDGCPEEDNDGDGLPDIGDVCPDAAEDENGFQDDDGCPDGGERASLVTLKRDRLRLHQPIRFVENRAALHESSNTILDAIAGLLREHPRLQLRIVVRPGKPNRGARRLAFDRANTIATELMGRGVDEQRMRIPETRYKARARRVELLVERGRRSH